MLKHPKRETETHIVFLAQLFDEEPSLCLRPRVFPTILRIVVAKHALPDLGLAPVYDIVDRFSHVQARSDFLDECLEVGKPTSQHRNSPRRVVVD
jgi:hypothetical protein